MKIGDRLEWFLKLEQEKGETPLPLRDMPELPVHLQFYWQAFWDLCGSRSGGMALMPIPVSEIDAYCRFLNIDGIEQRRSLMRFVQVLDGEYLAYHSKKSSAESERAKRKAASVSRRGGR